MRDFLVSRRANITPERAGVPAGGGERRVPGLRREEVALLAGVSVDYYVKLERGSIRKPSDSVLRAVARALQLDDVETAHLFDLARDPANRSHDARSAAPPSTVRASVQRVLDGMSVPALVYNSRQDVIGSNLLGRAMFPGLFEAEQPNMARFIFLDSRAQTFFGDWTLACSLTAAMLRYEAGRDPLDEEITAIVGELSMRSHQFRRDWADRDVHEHRTGTKTYHHPVVGEVDLTYDVFEMPGEPGLSVTSYTAEGGSESAEKLSLLASWAASQP
jgi:transcriptional regulator with XRE-family HTH domain